MLRIDLDFGGSGAVVDVEDALEGCAAVDGFVEAALVVGAVGVAFGRDEDDVGVGGVDGYLADLLGVAQAEVGPGLAGVGGLVDAVAGGEVGAGEAFAAADVDDVGVGGSYGYGAEWCRWARCPRGCARFRLRRWS